MAITIQDPFVFVAAGAVVAAGLFGYAVGRRAVAAAETESPDDAGDDSTDADSTADPDPDSESSDSDSDSDDAGDPADGDAGTDDAGASGGADRTGDEAADPEGSLVAEAAALEFVEALTDYRGGDLTVRLDPPEGSPPMQDVAEAFNWAAADHEETVDRLQSAADDALAAAEETTELLADLDATADGDGPAADGVRAERLEAAADRAETVVRRVDRLRAALGRFETDADVTEAGSGAEDTDADGDGPDGPSEPDLPDDLDPATDVGIDPSVFRDGATDEGADVDVDAADLDPAADVGIDPTAFGEGREDEDGDGAVDEQ